MASIPPYAESIWKRFWHALGGWKTIQNDGYLWASLVFTICTAPLWAQALWWDTTINVLAILIGFSISGFAVALSMADRLKGRELRRSSHDNSSQLVKLIAGYAYYLIVGFSALGFSLLCKAWYFPVWWDGIEKNKDYEFILNCISLLTLACWLLGGFLFCYSLMSALRCVMSIVRLAHIVQAVHDSEAAKQTSTSKNDTLRQHRIPDDR